MTVEKIVFGGSRSRISDAEEEYIRDAVAETDWEETPVVDVVKARDVKKTDDPPFPDYETHRYEGDLPDYDEYAEGRRSARVFRITEESCAQEGIDPETGDDLPEEKVEEAPEADATWSSAEEATLSSDDGETGASDEDEAEGSDDGETEASDENGAA